MMEAAEQLRKVEAALALHQSGRLQEAEALYREVLRHEPGHFDALQYLGVLRNQAGHAAEAAELIGRALRQDGAHPYAHNNLGLAQQGLGRLREAEASYRRALELKPDFADAHFNLGNVLQGRGQLSEAVRSYRQALALHPQDAEAHNNLGSALRGLGQLQEALGHYGQAVRLQPRYAEAWNNLGVAQQELGRLAEAEGSLRQALALGPQAVDVLENLGQVLQGQGRLEEALSSYRKSVELQPGRVEGQLALGNVLRESGRLEEALASYRRATELDPERAEAHNNLGTALNDIGKLGEAAESFNQAIRLKPDYAEAYSNLGGCLRTQGNLDAAMQNLRMAVALKPDLADARTNLIYTMAYLPDCTPQEYLQAACGYGNELAGKARPYLNWDVPEVSAAQPLNVGLVSGDLRSHPAGHFLENMLPHINPARLRLVAYSTNPREDTLTGRIKPYFSAWNLVTNMGDALLAQKIHADRIHILVDLSGYTARNRLSMFAWKPAPIQLSWLGYWASTGLPGMDYFLADAVSAPIHCQDYFSEKIWYLPDTRFCFTPPAQDSLSPVAAAPALSNGYVTFGSFQNLGKINERVLALWARVLAAIPNSRLRVQNKQMHCPLTRRQFEQQLTLFGIPPDRVKLEKSVPRIDYLAAHADVDIILDTFPFPGGTTTCESLWMGVPTLTLAGETLLGRQGVSMLTCVGMEDWIAEDEEDFVARAAAFAADIGHLSRLRAGLRQRVTASPLFDGKLFAGRLEAALGDMWRHGV